MKTLQYKDYHPFKNGKHKELIIIGGKTQLDEEQIKEVAAKFQITDYETKLWESHSASVNGGFEYFHYTLSIKTTNNSKTK